MCSATIQSGQCLYLCMLASPDYNPGLLMKTNLLLVYR